MEREIGASGRGCNSSGTEEKRALALVKAKANTGDQVRDFPGPFRASMRGARTQAANR